MTFRRGISPPSTRTRWWGGKILEFLTELVKQKTAKRRILFNSRGWRNLLYIDTHRAGSAPMFYIEDPRFQHAVGIGTGYLFNFNPHRSCSPRDNVHRGINIVGVEVLHLLLSNLAKLIFGHRTDLVLVRHTTTLL